MATDADSKSLDVFGTRPAARALEKATDAGIAGAGAFFGRICLPAAEEFGLLLKDKVSRWRAKNAAQIGLHAEKLIGTDGKNLHAHPRLVWEVIDSGSWSDDDVVLKMWGGLLAASCTDGKADDSNIIFTSLLTRLTSAQVRILAFACENGTKYVTASGLPQAERFTMTLEQLSSVTGVHDIHRLDRELDYLRSMELIGGGLGSGGFSTEGTTADVSITALAMHLYVRGQGYLGSPVEFWGLKPQRAANPPVPIPHASEPSNAETPN